MTARAAQPRKKPSQARARVLVDAIREACLRVLREEGPDALNTNRIAEVAGVSIGSLYQYFPNKEAILSEIFEEFIRREEQEIHERKAELRESLMRPLPEVLRWLVDRTADRHLRMLALHEDFYREYTGEFDIRDRVGRAELETWHTQTVAFLRELIDREGNALAPADSQRTADLCVRVLGATLADVARDDPALLRRVEFRDEMLLLLQRYLGVDRD